MACEICKKEFSSLGGLHLHVSKTHKLKQQDYYHSYFPRCDLFDKELIGYKNYEQYNSASFNSRENFGLWFNDNLKSPEVIQFCENELIKRAQRKESPFVPSQVELKSLYLPSIIGFEKLYGGISQFENRMKELGLKPKFDYSATPSVKSESPFVIYQDTREQLPLVLDCPVKSMKLSVGDYSISAPYFDDVFIERKSLGDLVGTLTAGKDRFNEELNRASSLNAYVVILIEEIYSEIYHYTSTNRYSKKVNGAHIFHEIRETMSQHNNCQFVCIGNRRRASKACVDILKLGSQVKNLDCEYLKDKGLI